ncbi:MAG: alpha-glucosidase/alpha-galactosidase [Planctomycetes bacterium]|nr:alpha-glucosidase/alpha-galactosidase [Planctomycetota bacterium]
MVRIVMLGAGSGFTHSLSGDIMQLEGVDGGELCLVDIDPKRLRLAKGLVDKIAQILGARKAWKITATTDRRKVLPGADFIINTIEVSGTKTVRIDNDIPLEYGVSQCIGDTIGPGGIFKAMRTVPVWIDVLRDAEQLAPDAFVLNYTNPMSIMTHAAMLVTDLPVVGLCHSVQGTSKLMADYCGVPYEELTWQCAGLNHMAWFTRLEHQGRDLYPALKKKVVRDKKLWERDPVRFDFMLHFGYFVTESSGHFSEYVPYYRKRKELRTKYCRPGYLGGDSFYANEWPGWRQGADAHRAKIMKGQEELKVGRSHEYASSIIQAIVTDKPFVFHGSQWNTGLIDNLPFDGVVEVPVLVNKTGYNPCHFGPVPEQCAALNRQHMAVNKLTAEACVEGDREKAMHALLLDPLTSAVCSPAEIKEMFDRMFKAERKYLKGF